jgi:hypothetical protein
MGVRESTIQEVRSKAVVILHLVLWVVLSFQVISLISNIISDPSFGIVFEPVKGGEVLKIRDFPFHFNFVQKFWRNDTTVSSGQSIYSVANHLKVTSEWGGKQAYGSLHFGYSPTMLWVLAPLTPLSHAAAYLIFNLAGLFAIFWMTRPARCRWGIGLFSFFSPISWRCFVLGQTALLTGMGLLFIAEKTRDERLQSWRSALITGGILWALTAKPPIALSAAAVLFGLRQWRSLAVAGFFTAASVLVIWPSLGPHWIADYVHLIRAYNKVDAGPIFAMSLDTHMMTNLRAVLNTDIGLKDNVASYVSGVVWLVALSYVAIMGLLNRVSTATLWSMGILSYLLFCPHVNTTEELQLVVILSLCVSLGKGLGGRELLLLIILPLLVFIVPLPGPFGGFRLPFFLVKLALFVFFAASGRSFESVRYGVAEQAMTPLPESAMNNR